jgi:hypothetical protein
MVHLSVCAVVQKMSDFWFDFQLFYNHASRLRRSVSLELLIETI